MSGGPSDLALKKARAWCVRQFAARYDRSAHASHLACQILRESDAKFSLESFGVEGHAWTTQEGFSYLNMGDTYALTLTVETSARSARFRVASWGAIFEARDLLVVRMEGGES